MTNVWTVRKVQQVVPLLLLWLSRNVHCQSNPSNFYMVFSTEFRNVESVQELPPLPHIRTTLDCARDCMSRLEEPSKCDGYRFDPSERLCRQFRGSMRSLPWQDGVKVHRVQYFQQNYPPVPVPANPNFIPITNRHHGIGKYFRQSDTEMTFSQARDQCTAMEGDLLHIRDFKDYWLFTAFLRLISPADEAWVGVSDVGQDGRWIALKTGSPVDLQAWTWQEGEPNDDPRAHCASMNISTTLLVARRCDDVIHHMCQRKWQP